jgi:aminopeptidase N
MQSLATQFQLPGSKPHYNPDIDLQTQHIFLDLLVDFQNKTVFGISNLKFKVLASSIDQIQIDAVDMEILQIDSKELGKNLKFEYDQKKILINLKKELKTGQIINLAIKYKTLNPSFGIFFVAPDEHYPNKPYQIWTQGESEGSRFWYPCLDFPKQIASCEVKVRTPKWMTVISNGVKVMEKSILKDDFLNEYLSSLTNPLKEKAVSKDSQDISISKQNYKITHWKQEKPIPNYLIVLTAGEFHEINDKVGDLPVNYYTSTSNSKQDLQITGQKTPRMIEFFEKRFGVKYPWDKYDQVWVNDFIWGGMENVSCTLNTSRALADKKSLQDFIFPEVLVAHELSHQWFGDLVIINHWKDLWVKEGAATYSESLWWEHEYGKAEFDYYRFNEWDEYISESYKRPTETNIYRHVEDLYDRHSYTKAGTIYHIIRAQLGDENFTKWTRELLTKYAHQNVQGTDLIRAAENVSGKNILPILDQFLYTSGHPDFEITFNWDQKNNLAKLSVKQNQATKKDEYDKIFNLEIPVALGFITKKNLTLNKKSKTYKQNNKQIQLKILTLKVSELEQNFYLPLDQKPDFINFDYENQFVKTIKLNYDLDFLKNQLLYSDDVISQIHAAIEIAKKNNLKALDILKEAYKKSDFWGLRYEIIKASSKIKLEQTFDLLKLAIKDKSSKVRTIAIESLLEFKTEQSFELAYKIAKNGDTQAYNPEATAIKILGKIADTLEDKKLIQRTFDLALQILESRDSWCEVLRSASLRALADLKNKTEVFQILLENTKLGKPLELRNTAISLLGYYAKYQDLGIQEKALDRLEELANENYIFVEMMTIASCNQLTSPRSLAILRKIKQKTVYGRIERKALESVDSMIRELSQKEARGDVQKQLEEIQKENKELRSRLEALEGRQGLK